MPSRMPWHRLIFVVAASLALPASLQAAGPAEQELIVLLAPSPAAPTPEELLAAVREGTRPADLPAGAVPRTARLLVPPARRATGAQREHLLAHPDMPKARLERYVVLRYPMVVDLERLIERIERDPKVEWVGPNLGTEFSATPNDPFYFQSFSVRQWGLDSLGFPTVWDTQPGHAYVGIVDTGIDVDHPDLRGQYVWGTHQWQGGAYRPHLSYDWAYWNDNVDEAQTEVVVEPTGNNCGSASPTTAGHGTHVAGIVAATENNAAGVAGACWDCSLLIHKASHLSAVSGCFSISNAGTKTDAVAAAITGAIDDGAQVINLSLGFRNHASCSFSPNSPLCTALDYAVTRDVVVVAASGNVDTSKGETPWSGIDFPASDGRTIAAAASTPSDSFWSGNYYSTTQYAAPGTNILSTFYIGRSYNPSSCDDSLLAPSGDGYGPCTGTSMAAPHLSAVAAMVKSTNPWLTRNQTGWLFMWNTRLTSNWTNNHGRGIPEADEILDDALGRVGGSVLPNRLTPLFSLYSSVYKDWFYTTFPQWGTVARAEQYVSTGPDVGGYGDFPGAVCWQTSCPAARASLYVFTGKRAPFTGAPPLVPLYRMSYKNPSGPDRDTAYAIDSTGILGLAPTGLQVDGVEGYLYAPCTPEPSCIPAGAVRVLQRYNSTRNDHAVFPENELAAMQSAGYTQIVGPGLLGYAYRNLDGDGDDVVDGFEALIGTAAGVADSDCDGVDDGDEILVWGTSGYRDPLDGSCP